MSGLKEYAEAEIVRTRALIDRAWPVLMRNGPNIEAFEVHARLVAVVDAWRLLGEALILHLPADLREPLDAVVDEGRG